VEQLGLPNPVPSFALIVVPKADPTLVPNVVPNPVQKAAGEPIPVTDGGPTWVLGVGPTSVLGGGLTSVFITLSIAGLTSVSLDPFWEGQVHSPTSNLLSDTRTAI
jgi:hypothetical protein